MPKQQMNIDMDEELVFKAEELEIDICKVCNEALWSAVHGRDSIEMELLKLQAEERLIREEHKEYLYQAECRELRLEQIDAQIEVKGAELKEFKIARTVQILMRRLNRCIEGYDFVPINAWDRCQSILEQLDEMKRGFTKESFFNHCVMLRQYQKDIKP